jgi:DNA-directed RNA polymerase specialized sigma subunit
MKKRRRPRTKNRYFTKVHEDAIVQYSSTTSREIRTDLYISLIEPAFNELVDKIVYTYKFNTLPNIDYLKDDCKLWLITILDKYDPNRNSKAFSYFSVITKNWFIHKVKQNSKRLKRDVQYEDLNGEAANEILVTHNTYISDREHFEFWQYLWREIDSWEKLKLKDNEKKVLNAVKILFESVDEIEIFNKKAIYLYMREITGLNTKQIVNNLNRIRKKYKDFKTEWEKGNI